VLKSKYVCQQMTTALIGIVFAFEDVACSILACFKHSMYKYECFKNYYLQTPLRGAHNTGYNQSVTGCGSQRRHVDVSQRKLI